MTMDERVLISTEQVLNVMLRALRDAQLQAIAYKAEADRLRKELDRVRKVGE